MAGHCPLYSLSNELLTKIFDFLYDLDNPKSFINLALTSKHCYEVATPLAYSTLIIKPWTPTQLRRAVRQCCERLERDTAFRHVRKLLIRGEKGPLRSILRGWPRGDRIVGSDEWSPSISRLSETLLEVDNLIPDSMDMKKPWYFDNHTHFDWLRDNKLEDKGLRIAYYEAIHDNNRSWYEQANRAWMPLADLIKRLPGLAQVHFSCLEQFPPCLLEAIHQRGPKCRLYLNEFVIPGDVLPSYTPTKLRTLTPHEKSILSSPCLYKIQAQTDWSWSIGLTMQIASIATNLREITIGDSQYGREMLVAPAEPKGPADLQSLTQQCLVAETPNDARLPAKLAFLRCLELKGRIDVTAWHMQEWARHIDFSRLQVLKLDSEFGISHQALTFLAIQCAFPVLTCLSLVIPRLDCPRERGGVSRREWDNMVSRLLGSMPVLTSLRMCNLDKARYSLPRTLQRLSIFNTALSSREVASICKMCPIIEELTLPVRRDGNVEETRVYEELSRFRKLRRLEIGLVVNINQDFPVVSKPGRGYTCLPPLPPDDDRYTDFDREWFTKKMYIGSFPRFARVRAQHGHLIHYYRKSAIDDKLVRSIFDIVASGAPMLERLRTVVDPNIAENDLQTKLIRRFEILCDSDHLPCVSMIQILNNLQREWIVTRNPVAMAQHGDQEQGQKVTVVDCGRTKRGWDDDGKFPVTPERAKNCLAFRVFRHVWPAPKDENGDEVEEDWPWAYESVPLPRPNDGTSDVEAVNSKGQDQAT
ncbi:hypothetical protein B0T21DRAFT_373102 [Apiosordaria backusii]|uniref:F-box domain-containing protein n=1 Tax=Apiosordaria backusii TaxID=314023 RepID=A0AA40E187_9PEZI|nr:hypothetical protein B0T21DRAFT_373102 [Apiosordaria backusii]